METATRFSSVGRWFDAAALVVGRTVTRAAGVLPRVVRRASGIDDPSPEAVMAGVVRGITMLAPKTMGPVSACCLNLIGAVAVLALATLAVYLDVEDADLCGGILAGAITLAAQRGLCKPSTASLWRLTVGGGLPDRALLAPNVRGLPRWISAAVARDSLDHALGDATRALRPLHIATALGGAWTAMGEAARLVEATRAFAREYAAVEDAALMVDTCAHAGEVSPWPATCSAAMREDELHFGSPDTFVHVALQVAVFGGSQASRSCTIPSPHCGFDRQSELLHMP